MAIIHLDGFDGASDTTEDASNLDTEAYLEARYGHPVWSGFANPQVLTGWGGVGKALSFGRDGNGSNNWILTKLPEIQTIYCGFAFRSHGGLSATSTLLLQWSHLADAATHVTAELVSGRHISFIRAGVVIAKAYNVCHPGRWSYIEIKLLISATVGVIEVRSNGAEILNETGLNTRNGGAGDDMDNVYLVGVDGSGADEYEQGLFDDYYIVDETGSNNVDFLGPIKIEEILPDGPGDSADFTPNAGSNYQTVDETPRDDDATYNEDTVSTNKDLFTASNLVTLNDTIFGLAINALGRVTDGTPYTLVTKIKRSTSEGTGTGASITDTVEYVSVSEIFEQDPAAGPGDWLVTTINNMQIGYEVG